MLFRLGVITVAAAALTSAAVAADLPVKAPPAVAPAFLPFTWTGPYAGANGGFGWSNGGAGLDATGGFGGGQIGYNVQTGNLVFGVEGDISGGGISRSINTTVGGLPFTSAFDVDGLASLRARAGIAAKSWLFYGTVGAGFAHDATSGTTTAGIPFSNNEWLSGWTAGAGVEWQLGSNWSTKLEYLHYGLGSPNSFGNPVPAGKVDIDTLKIGINYLFR